MSVLDLLSRGKVPQLIFYPYVSENICPSSDVVHQMDIVLIASTKTGSLRFITCLIHLRAALQFNL